MVNTIFRKRIIRVFIVPVLIIFTIGVPLMFHTYTITQARYYAQENYQALERFKLHYTEYNRQRVDSIIQMIKVHTDEKLTITDPQMHILGGDSVPGFDYDISHYKGSMSTVWVNGQLITVLHTLDEEGYVHWDMLPHMRAFSVVYRSMLVFLLAALFSVSVSLLIYRYSLAPGINKIIASDERMKTELNIAHKVQLAMVPHSREKDISAILLPAREVGGDLYDYVRVGERLYFCIGDVSDKGVPAAMMMTITRSLFHQTTELGLPLQKSVRQMNHTFSVGNSRNMFCTFFAGCLNMNTLNLEYINCGHCAPIIRKQNGEIQTLDCEPNVVLGIIDHFDFQLQEVQLDRYDSLLLYTDGVTEAMNTSHEQFGLQRLLQVASSVHDGIDMPATVMQAVQDFRGDAEQNDDITMMVVQVSESEQIIFPSVKGHTVEIVDAILDKAQRSDDLRLRLAIEEIVSNIGSYAYEQDGELAVTVHRSLYESNESAVTLEFADQGIPFNPLLATDPDVTATLEERKIGGWGIFLARRIADLTYRYEHGTNHLSMTYKA